MIGNTATGVISVNDARNIVADGTGTVTVEIDRRAWGALTVTANDTVEITEDIDRETGARVVRIEVEVNSIRRI